MRHHLALLAVCLLTFGLALGRSAITDSDEAYYAEAGREMLVTGDWTTPHFNGEPRLQKPVLFYWLIAATYSLGGVSEFNARLWSALAGLGVAFVTAAIGRRWFGPSAGTMAGLIVATSFSVVLFARQSLPDMPLAFFVSVSTWAALEAFWIDDPTGTAERRRRRPLPWMILAAAAAALGMLDKGPVAVVLPGTVLLPVLFWQYRRTGRRAWPGGLRPVHLAAAAGVFLLIAAPWYLAVMQAQGLDYARRFFIGENVERFASSTYNQWRGWMYIPVIVAGLLPWSAFFLLWRPALRDGLAGRRRWTLVEARLICWTLGPLAFFMISVGSQPRYILPCLVPVAILLGRSISVRAGAPAPAPRDGFRAASALAATCMLVVAGLLWRAAAVFREAGADVSVLGPVLMVGVAVVALAGVLMLPRRMAPGVLSLAAAASLVIFATTLLSPPRPEAVETVGALVREQPAGVDVCACGVFDRSLGFYARRTVITAAASPDYLIEVADVLARDAPVLAAVDRRTLDALERDGRPWPRLAEVTYLNMSVWQRGETLVRPDASAVQRVAVVTNQRSPR